jgi:ATP-dependent Clp endopeptidase proteolytic subunit ClpP
MNLDEYLGRVQAPRNGTPREWYHIRWLNSAKDGETGATARIDLYDEIDPFWGISAANFVTDLRALEADTIELHVNSPGGSVYDGIAIMNALRQHDARVVAIVDGYAASAAGFIAVGASDELVMAENSEFMAHDAWGIAIGPASDMRSAADDLDRLSTNIASIYQRKAGGSVDDWRGVMEAETWYSAEETVAAGLADRVLKLDKPSEAKNSIDLAKYRFNFAGRRAAPAPRPIRSPSAVRAEVKREEGHMPTLIEGLRERLGLPADADEATVLEKVSAELDSTGAATGEPDPADAPSEPTLTQIAASAKRLNLRLVDAEQYEQTVQAATKGAKAFEQQRAEHREHVLSNAVRTGRIAKAQREMYAKQLERDPDGTEAFLATLPANLAVPLEEIGHAGEPDVDHLEADVQSTFAKITGSNWKA